MGKKSCSSNPLKRFPVDVRIGYLTEDVPLSHESCLPLAFSVTLARKRKW